MSATVLTQAVRHVFAFEGRGGFPTWATPGGPTAPRRRVDVQGRVIPEWGRLAPAQVLSYWYDAACAAGPCHWHYYAQNHWRRAVADALSITVDEGAPRANRTCCARIALLGFSNGGDAVYQVAWALGARAVEVDLAVTADPVRKPLRGLGLLGFRKPPGVKAWHNFYQRCDRRTLGGWLPVVGRSVVGADTDRRLAAEDFCRPMDPATAHLWIPAHPLVTRTITEQMAALG